MKINIQARTAQTVLLIKIYNNDLHILQIFIYVLPYERIDAKLWKYDSKDVKKCYFIVCRLIFLKFCITSFIFLKLKLIKHMQRTRCTYTCTNTCTSDLVVLPIVRDASSEYPSPPSPHCVDCHCWETFRGKSLSHAVRACRGTCSDPVSHFEMPNAKFCKTGRELSCAST